MKLQYKFLTISGVAIVLISLLLQFDAYKLKQEVKRLQGESMRLPRQERDFLKEMRISRLTDMRHTELIFSTVGFTIGPIMVAIALHFGTDKFRRT